MIRIHQHQFLVADKFADAGRSRRGPIAIRNVVEEDDVPS